MKLVWKDLVSGPTDRPPLHLPFSGAFDKPGLFAVKGPNGCGKSTLMRTWLGLVPPRSGTLNVERNTKSAVSPSPSRGVGYVPQAHRVNDYFHIAVRDFIAQGLGPHGIRDAKDAKRVEDAIEQWQLTADRQRSFHELSGGQKTRAMVARAIVSTPSVVFLDEPLASLDACCQQLLMETLHGLTHSEEVKVIMVDHHFDRFERYLSGTFWFRRFHDREICAVEFLPSEDTCRSPV